MKENLLNYVKKVSVQPSNMFETDNNIQILIQMYKILKKNTNIMIIYINCHRLIISQLTMFQ